VRGGEALLADLPGARQAAAEAHAVEIFPALESLKHLALHAEDVLRDDPVEAQVLLFAQKTAGWSIAPPA